MTKIYYAAGVLLVVIIAGALLVGIPGKSEAPTGHTGSNATTTPFVNPYPDSIVIDSPKPGDTISGNTVVITGKARGTWYFEGSFPVEISNLGGTTIGRGHAEAQSDWMTTEFVPFVAKVTITSRSSDGTPMEATIKLKNDNPSGDPAKDKSVSIPVVFK